MGSTCLSCCGEAAKGAERPFGNDTGHGEAGVASDCVWLSPWPSPRALGARPPPPKLPDPRRRRSWSARCWISSSRRPRSTLRVGGPAEAVPPRNRPLLVSCLETRWSKQTAAKVPGSGLRRSKKQAPIWSVIPMSATARRSDRFNSVGVHDSGQTPWWATCLLLAVLTAPVTAGASEPTLVISPQIKAEVATELDFHVQVASTNPVPADCSIIITGLPKSVTFSAGSAMATGVWEVPLLALDRLKMVVPASEASSSILIIFLAIKKKDDLVILASARSFLFIEAPTEDARPKAEANKAEEERLAEAKRAEEARQPNWRRPPRTHA